jgi:hypothetical protein
MNHRQQVSAMLVQLEAESNTFSTTTGEHQMQNFIEALKAALKLVQADASKQLLPLFKTMVSNTFGNGFDLINATLQFNEFLTSAAALLPTLTKELQTSIGNALVAWADATAGTTPPPAA